MAATISETRAAPDATPITYDAFISYSRRDSAFVQKLYGALSSYTPPSGLDLPARRLRVFLDKSDFTGVDYSAAVARHLERSAKLLVVCSPNARTHPKYINDEIRLFVSRRGAENVIPLLLAGIPNNEAVPGQEGELAFPDALCEALGTPLAREFRGFDDRTRHIDRGSFEESWYFLLADIYGKTRAEIERRDQVRRTRNQRRLLAGAAVLVAVLATLTAVALVQRKAAVENADLARAREVEATQQRKVAVDQRNLAEANAELAAKNERTAEVRRVEAEEQRASALKRLVRLYLSNAQRRVELQDTPGAALWYAEALKVRDDESIRIRLGTLLQTYPRLVRVFGAPQRGCDFSPDGRRIACSDGGRRARIWDVAGSGPTSPPLDQRMPIVSVTFSPDGRRVLVADTGGGLRVWDAANGRSVAAMTLGKSIRQALFSPAGDRVIAADEAGSMRVWDTETGRPATSPMTHTFPVRFLEVSPDGTRVATILDDKTVFPTLSVWDIATGQLAAPPVKRPLNGFSVAFANAHDPLYTQITNGELRLCDGVSGACRATKLERLGVESTVFSADGRRLLVNGSDHIVRTIDVQTGEAVGGDLKHGPLVGQTLFSPDATKILTVDYKNALRIWDAPTGRDLRAPVEHVALAWFSADGRLVATLDDSVSASPDVQVWHAGDGYAMTVPMRQSQNIRDAKFSADGRYLLIVGSHSSWLWDLEPGALRVLPESAGGRLWAVGFSPSNDPVLLTGSEREVRVWDINAQRHVTPPMPHDGSIEKAWFTGRSHAIVTQSFVSRPGQRSVPVVEAWDATGRRIAPPLSGARVDDPPLVNADGRRLLVRMDDGPMRIWDLSGRGSMADVPKGVRAMGFTASGICIALTAGPSTLRISDRLDGAARGPDLRDTATVERVALAPDCRHVSTIDKDKRLRVWDTSTGRFVVPRRQDDDQFGYFLRAVFSPDGEWFATEANDGSVRVWSASTGVPRTGPLGYLQFVDNVAFSGDGRYVMATGHDATAMVWDAATGETLVALKGLLCYSQQ